MATTHATTTPPESASTPPVDPSVRPAPAWIGAVMPWAISLFFHLGVGLILAFAMAVTVATTSPPIDSPHVVFDPMARGDTAFVPARYAPTPDNAAGRQPPRDPYRDFIDNTIRTDLNVVLKTPLASAVTTMMPDGQSGLTPSKAGQSGGSLFTKALGNPRASRAGGPRQDQGLAAVNNMIFVIDRSGSMITDLPQLQMELNKTVRMLKPQQRFSLVLFTSGEPREFTPGRLVAADTENKNRFFEYVQSLEAAGRTDPMPALKRAFALAKSAPKTQYTAICLLSDGVFPDADAVTAYVSQATRETNIHVFTYLYGPQNKDAEMMMKTIAHEGKGGYNFVARE